MATNGHSGDAAGTSLLPYSRLQRLFARRASSLGAAVFRTLPAGRGWPGRGCIRVSQGQVATPATTPTLAPPRSFRERGPVGPEPAEPGAEQSGASGGQEDAALSCAPPGPAPAPPRAQVSGRAPAPREGVAAAEGRTKTHFRGVWGPGPGPAAHSRS